MTEFKAVNPDFAAMIEDKLRHHGPLYDPGTRLVEAAPGYCVLRMPFSDAVRQHAGYFHGGATGALADAAGGFAAWTLLPADADVRTVEYKINFTRAASGAAIIATARVIKPGRSLTVTQIDVEMQAEDGTRRDCALMQQTIITIPSGG